MADITQNPPKDETTPGQSIESRKTGEKKVVEELQEFNTKTEQIAKDAKSGFRAVVEGIKAGNAEMNPEKTRKTTISGFKELSASQENAVRLFGEMKESADKSQSVMAKDMAIEKGNKLEAQQEQVGLWGRMLMRLIGIDEDLDKLIKNTTPVPGEKSWFGKIVTGLLLGGIVGLVAGIVFGFGEVLLFYFKMWGKAFRFLGRKFLGSKFMKPIVDPITNFFKGIGNRIKKIGKGTRSSLVAPIANFFKDIIRQFKAGFRGSKGAVATSKGFAKANIFARIGKAFGAIAGFMRAVWAPIKAFNAYTMVLWKGTAATGKTVKATSTMFGGFFKGLRGFFRGLGLVFKPMWAAFKIGIKVMAPIGRVFGRLFLPLTIIMGLVDGIRGFIDGFKNTEGNTFSKIIGGLIGGIKGIVSGLIMMPLDMIKNAVAWILGKFGFDGLAKGLKSFSFVEIYENLVDMFTDTLWAVVDWFKLLFSDPGAALKKLVAGYVGLLAKFWKMILRFILPDPKGGKWYNPLSLIQKAIPDRVYTWAGLDPDTGEKIPQPGDEGYVEPPPKKPVEWETEGPLLSRWGTNIKKKFGWDDEVDPINTLQTSTGTNAQSQGANANVFVNAPANKGGDVINIMGGDTGGAQTLATVTGAPGGG